MGFLKTRNIIVLFVLTLAGTASTQTIKLTVKNLQDTAINMARYNGKKLYYADTAMAKNGTVTFNAENYKPGIYALIVPPKNSYFEIVVDGEEDITMSTSGPAFAKNMNIKKSEENKAFYKYVSFMGKMKGKMKQLSQQSKNASKNGKKKSQKKIKDLRSEVEKFRKKFFDENDNLLVSKYLKIMNNIEIPDPPKKEDGSIDSTFAYTYQMKHYFDNVDLKDDRLVRGPMFHNRLNNYFSKNMMIQQPDTITKYADLLISKLDKQSELFKYVVHHITYKYETSKIMGMDAVFVHMAKKYYCPPESSMAYWLSQKKLKKLCKRMEKLNPLRIGQKAPYLSLTDSTEEKWINFYDLPENYVVLYFWDPECGHCKKVTPKLQATYKDTLKNMGVEVYAVGKAMGKDFKKWKDYIHENDLSFINVGLTKNIFNQAQENAYPLVQEHTTTESLNYHDTYDVYSTPKIFVVNKDREIIAKGLGVGQIVDFIKKHKERNAQ